MKTIENKIYQRIDAITGGVLKFITSPNGYLKLKQAGYMDLTIERLSSNEVSLTHYYEQNGDLVPDPDMQVVLDFEKYIASATSFQNCINYISVYPNNGKIDLKLQQELNSHLLYWLKNLKAQGFY